MTEEQQAWAAAWVECWASIPTITKGRTADMKTFTYEYADLGDIINTVKAHLQGHGFAVSQSVFGSREDTERILVETRVTHKGGHTETYGPTAIPFKGDARAAGSAITYARRYALAAALGIATEDDTDAAPVKAAPVSLHDKAWFEVYGMGFDDPAEVFREALLAADIHGGIETQEQYDAVMAGVSLVEAPEEET